MSDDKRGEFSYVDDSGKRGDRVLHEFMLGERLVDLSEVERAGKKRVGDAAPRTLYVRRNVINAEAILAWAREQGIANPLPGDELHVTVAFSRQPVDWMRVEGNDWNENESGELRVKPGGVRLLDLLGPEQDALVLMFACSPLSWRHEQIKRAGASWDWPEYQPHITIAYGSGHTQDTLRALEPYRGEIVLGPEVFEEVDEGWKAKLLNKGDADV